MEEGMLLVSLILAPSSPSANIIRRVIYRLHVPRNALVARLTRARHRKWTVIDILDMLVFALVFALVFVLFIFFLAFIFFILVVLVLVDPVLVA